jgi:hypothetical protein
MHPCVNIPYQIYDGRYTMIYVITYDEKMLIRRRVRVEAKYEEDAIRQVKAGHLGPREILINSCKKYLNIKIRERHGEGESREGD